MVELALLRSMGNSISTREARKTKLSLEESHSFEIVTQIEVERVPGAAFAVSRDYSPAEDCDFLQYHPVQIRTPRKVSY